MAFPTPDAAPTVTTFTSAAQAHAANMPAAVAANQLLVAIVTMFVVGSPPTITTPDGWTQKWHTQVSVAGDFTFACYVKKADGTEDGGTVNFQTDTNTTGIVHAYVVSDWYEDLAGVEAGTAVTDTTGSNINPDPPSLTPSWGALDTLWFCGIGASDDGVVFSITPANYTSTHGNTGLGANATVEMLSGYRQLNALSEDPGAAEFASGEFWAANTLAVRPGPPAGGGGTAVPVFHHHYRQMNAG